MVIRMRRRANGIFVCIACSVLALSCQIASVSDDSELGDLQSLPQDSGGTHYSYVLNSTDSPYGHYVYIPGGYGQTEQSYPLLISLHGSGERGNSASSASQLERVLKYGPQKMIEDGEWNPTYPMIVATPQTSSSWKSSDLAEFIDYLCETYRINASRIYLTGLSLGGEGLYNYLKAYGQNAGIAAAVPLCGKVNTSNVEPLRYTPLWVFHGDSDTSIDVDLSKNLVSTYNNLSPTPEPTAKLTIFPGVGHNCWTKVYDGSGMGSESDDYDAFDQSIYDWMFQYSN